MCLIVFAWKQHADYPLILAGNRDELHARPAREMHWWPDRPGILAGRDLQAGGSWLAIAKSGRVAAVTNYRENARHVRGQRSRGDIVSGFVSDDETPLRFATRLNPDAYAGFSLLAAHGDELVYTSNRGEAPVSLAPGVYGLSNAALDTPWPKLVRCRDKLTELLGGSDINLTRLFRIIEDREPAPIRDIEAGDMPFERARALSAPFIVTPEYGTRCSTALLCRRDGQIEVGERRFDATGRREGDSHFRFATAGEVTQRDDQTSA